MALLLSVFLFGCSPPKDALIVPAKRVGEIEIGRTKASEVGTGDGSVYEKSSAEGLSIGFDEHLRVYSIEVLSRGYKTEKGLGVGSMESTVVSTYGKPEVIEVPLMAGNVQKGTLAKRALHYPGIRYLLDDQHQVMSVIVSAR